MKQSGECPKCASPNVVADAKAQDRSHYGAIQDLSVGTFRNPDAKIFKEHRQSTVSAWVCLACGFIEFYADDPKALVS